MSTPKFANVKGSTFHAELKKRVNQYFIDKKIKATGNLSLYFKAILLSAIYFAFYIHIVFFTPTAWLAVLECFMIGGVTAAIGFNVMHDGAHGSFSSNNTTNWIAAFSANVLGASGIMWHQKHNILHHTYTNIDGVDDDIEIKPFIRMCRTQKRYLIHRFQHIYVWFLYTLLLLIWLFVSDYSKYFSKKIGDVKIIKLSTKEHLGFWLAKAGYFIMMIILPIYMVGFLPWLVGFLCMALFAGLVLSTVFQLAHTVEETSFPLPNADTNKLENEWAIHQLETTANFATNSKTLSWLLGGLNFQIEHHLFPRISHIHYPALSKIVRETCREFNIKYLENKRMWGAIISHTVHLKKMGSAV